MMRIPSPPANAGRCSMPPSPPRTRSSSWGGFSTFDDTASPSRYGGGSRKRSCSLPGPKDPGANQQVNPRDLIEFFKEQEMMCGRYGHLPKRLLELHGEPYDRDLFPVDLTDINRGAFDRPVKCDRKRISNGNVSRGSLPGEHKQDADWKSSTMRLLAGASLRCPSISSIVESRQKRNRRAKEGDRIRSFSVADTLSTLRATKGIPTAHYLQKSFDNKFCHEINGGLKIKKTSLSSSFKLSVLDDAFSSIKTEPTKQSLISSFNTVGIFIQLITILYCLVSVFICLRSFII